MLTGGHLPYQKEHLDRRRLRPKNFGDESRGLTQHRKQVVLEDFVGVRSD